jgi:hypothetical protein
MWIKDNALIYSKKIEFLTTKDIKKKQKTIVLLDNQYSLKK